MNGSNGRFVLGLVLGLLCGGGLFYWIAGRGAETTAAESDALDRDVSPISASNAPSDQLPDSDASGGRQGASQASVSTKELDSAEIRKLVADLDLAPASQVARTGAIFGRVVDDSGAGLAGVTVRMSSAGNSYTPTSSALVGQAPPKLDTLEDVVREAAKQFHESSANNYESVTDAAGRYRVENLPARNWKVAAYFAGYQVDPDSSAIDVQIDSELNFTAARVVEFAVSVYDPNGELAQSATLQCKVPDQPLKTKGYAWTSEEAFARLAPGEYEMMAFSTETTYSSRANRASESKTVVVLAEGMQPVRFDMHERRGIRGIVRQAAGELKSDYLFVRVMPLGPQQAVNLTELSRSGDYGRVRSGAEYTFPDLEPGRYLVGAAHSYSSDILIHQVLEVADGWVHCDLEVPSIDQGRHLRVTVIGPDGKVVSGVRFSLRAKTGVKENWGHVAPPKRDKEGAYLIAFEGGQSKIFFESTSSEDKFTLTANHDELGTRDVELTLGQPEVRIEYDVPGMLTVTVRGYAGSGLEGRLEVNAMPYVKGREYGSSMSTKISSMSIEGVQEFTGLKPGLHVLELVVRQGGEVGAFWSNTRVDRVEVNILPGRNEYQFILPPLYSIRVHSSDAKQSSAISLSSVAHSNGSALVHMNGSFNANGFATFEDVRAGEFTLSSSASLDGRGGQMRITVPCKEIEFEPQPVNALRVYVSDETGDLFRVGLRSEDLVIGADGAEFHQAPNPGTLVTTLGSTVADIVLMVERNGKQVDVIVRKGDIGDWGTMGGRLTLYAR